MSPAVKDIKDLESAIADDQARIAEINRTVAYNQRKRDLLVSGLTEAEKAELNPPAPISETVPAPVAAEQHVAAPVSVDA
jgi:hypothetical protein